MTNRSVITEMLFSKSAPIRQKRIDEHQIIFKHNENRPFILEILWLMAISVKENRIMKA